MHTTFLFGCLALVISLEFQLCHSAFKSGSAYRQNWGFKRSSSNIDWLSHLLEEHPQRQVVRIPVREIVSRITSDPQLAYSLVDAYMDKNGDGFVTEEEFLG